MQKAPVPAERRPRLLTCVPALLTWFLFAIPIAALLSPLPAISGQQAPPQKSSEQKKKLPKPRELDLDITWQRDPATGELYSSAAGKGSDNSTATRSPAPAIRVTSQIVPVTCSVFNSDGTAIADLKRSDFRILRGWSRTADRLLRNRNRTSQRRPGDRCKPQRSSRFRRNEARRARARRRIGASRPGRRRGFFGAHVSAS